MNIQLIQGQFSGKEAIDLLTELIHVKVKFHERLISREDNEEDIKMREKRIKILQKDLFEARRYIEQKGGTININATVDI
ncbi:MAG: hypothetical protein MUF58_11885 [Arcicella sp.]|jgi:hypothetical protein|nr:hypothetical protein [Arcicella sp.]